MLAPKAEPLIAATDAAREQKLIERVLVGEPELFYQLVQPYERRVYLAAWAILRSEADAEEAAQEAILKAFQHLSSFRGEARFSTWLARIVTNEALMLRRKNHTKLHTSIDAGESSGDDGEYKPMLLADWREIPSEMLERQEVRQEIDKALAALPEIYREVLIFRDVQQFNIAETAAALGIKPGMVKTRLSRARLRMRDLLAPRLSNMDPRGRSSAKGRKPWF